MHPVLVYGSSVGDQQGVVRQEELESVQKRAARFTTDNYNYETGSMTGIPGQLKWESVSRKGGKTIALWSPAGKGLTSWLSFVVSYCEFVTFPLVSWVGCGT